MNAVQYLNHSNVEDMKRDDRPPRYGRNVDGYGSKIPTDSWVKVENRWRRVYVTIWSNCGTPWITIKGERLVLAPHTLTALTGIE